MKKKFFIEQIVGVLKQADVGTLTADLIRKVGITEQTYYRWKAKYARLELESFSIITTEPNELVAPVHNRMPANFERQDYDRWLSENEPGKPPVDLLRAYDADQMKAWKADPAVGSEISLRLVESDKNAQFSSKGNT